MKNYLLKTLTIAFTALALLTIQSCDTDPCSDVDCGPNGICFEGICECDSGYDGNNCEIVIRSLFIGTFDATEICDTTPDGEQDDYVSEITESFDGPEYIVIDNVVLIEAQGFTSGALPNYEIIGGGTYDPATAQITLEYSITDLDEEPDSEYYSDYCTVVYTPR